MAWDGTPWFIGGEGAVNSAVAQLLPYVAANGGQGVLGSGHCKVRAKSVPTSSVWVGPGLAVVNNKASGALWQAYAGRNLADESVNIAATTSAGGRSDLIIARIENPNSAGEAWGTPGDPANGPYLKTQVISGVPSTTVDVSQVRPQDSAITLARIDIPVSTSTITNAMIKDLRGLVNQRTQRVQRFYDATGQSHIVDTTSYAVWPNVLYPVAIPAWAVSCFAHVTMDGVLLQPQGTNAFDGRLRLALGATKLGPETYLDFNTTLAQRATIGAGAVWDVSDIAGTSANLQAQAYRAAGQTSFMRLLAGSLVTFDLKFSEEIV